MDYEKLGFRCGIEIHQQLETHKLFCSCPSIVHDKNPDIKIMRKLRASAGETGKVDAAAAYEQAKKREFIYEACSTSSCLVELDEEPPHSPNFEAIQIALQVAKMLNAKVVDEIQVMRKTVVDGSNVSGFQRTMLVATDGYIETSLGRVGIPTICLEEEAAKRIKTDQDSTTFRLDRLGVPLIEIGTDAAIKNPEHAKETAKNLGMILRSTGKVKRGIGTIRQDVNVSIKGHPRVEIKGFQDLKSMSKIIEYEVKRQQKEKNGESHVRKAEPDGTTSFLRPMPGSARMYPETDITPIKPLNVEIEEVELIDDKIVKLEQELKINGDLARFIVKQNIEELVREIVKKSKSIKPTFIAEVITTAKKQIQKQFNVGINPTDEDFKVLFEALDNETLAKENVAEVLKENKPIKDVLEKYALMSDEELENILKGIVDKNKDAPFNVVMGQAMAILRGKASGKKVSEILKKLVK